MRKLYLFAFLFFSQLAVAQNSALHLNGAFIRLNGGNSSSEIYLMVNQSDNFAIKRTSGHIISESQYNYLIWSAGTETGEYVIPFGYNNTDYLPLTFKKKTAASAMLGFSTWATGSDNTPWAGATYNSIGAVTNMNSVWGGSANSSVIDRWWDIIATSATTADVTFSYRGVENTMTTGTTGPIDAQHWNGTAWDIPVAGNGTGVTSGVGSTTVLNANTFSPWVLVARSAPLPVRLTKFEARCNEVAELYWTTLSETNSSLFTIERSNDGELFYSIGTINAAGNSNSKIDYHFTDNTSFTDHYYRLKEIDVNGDVQYSEIIASHCSGKKIKITAHTPGKLYIQNEAQETEAMIEILDMQGKEISRNKIIIAKGEMEVQLKTEISTGLYLVRISNSSLNIVTKAFVN